MITPSPSVPRKIVDFHRDPEGHWVARLECGHTQHVRHTPPWQNRPWVVTEEGRRGYIGRALQCVHCATQPEGALPATAAAAESVGVMTVVEVAEAVRSRCLEAAVEAYQDAGVRGLCPDGRWEAATSAIRSLKLEAVVENLRATLSGRVE